MSLCRCGKYGRNHEITDACLSPEDQELVRQFKAAYDMADLGPWWHQAAGVVTPSQADRQPPASSTNAKSGETPVAPETTKRPDLVTHHEET